MKKIKLSQGKYALVDDADYKRLNKFKWAYVTDYAARTVYDEPLGKRLIKMHRVLVKASDHARVYHINKNKLDNRRKNLKV